MRNKELKKARDKALCAVYRKALAECTFATMREVARYVCKQPAPRFYIEAEKASILIGRILSNVSLINQNNCTRRLSWELFRRYKAYLAAHPDSKLSRERVLELLVDEPAPEFYIEAQCARKIIYKERKRRKQEWEKTLHV